MSDHPAPMGHNRGPVTPPKDEEVLDDLKTRYPEVQSKLAEFEAALATYPTEFGLRDEAKAAALQDLLGQMEKQKRRLGADKKDEKDPWDKITKIVINFFAKGEEKIGEHLKVWRPRHQAYIDLKGEENKRLMEEEAERQRAEAARIRAEAEAAEERRRAAEEAEQAAIAREEQARREVLEAEERKRAAEESAKAAKAEEDRITAERRERERAEKAQNAEAISAIKRHMKTAQALDETAVAEVASEDDIRALDDLIRPGGTISILAGPVASSALLDDTQRAFMDEVRGRLAVLRTAAGARLDAKERKRREKARKDVEAIEAAQAEARRIAREADEARAAEAKRAREAAEAEAAAAKDDLKGAKKDVTAARREAGEAYADQKDAGRDAKRLGTDADRTANRADRLDRKVESGEAESVTLRGDLGSTGSRTGRWIYEIVDEEALRAVCGPLGPHFTEDALGGAAYRWMAAHREGFTGERVEGDLAGVVFIWDRTSMIRA